VDPTSAPGPAAPGAKQAVPVDSLNGRTVALLKNAWPSWHRMTDRFERLLTDRVAGIVTEQHLIPNGSAADPGLLASIAEGADAAVIGLANCGSCTAWSFHDALSLSALGLPVVLVVTSEFTSLVRALSATKGVSLPTVVIGRNPETVDEATALDLIDHAYQAIVDALVTPALGLAPASALVGAGARVLNYSDEDAALAACHEYGWTDGLPVVLPTVPRVEAMLAGPGDAGAVVAAMPPSGLAVTGRALAANAVMAGCLPEHLPVLAALVRAVCAPEFNLNGIATTTGPSTPFAVVSGPAAARAGVNAGRGALGPGWRANASIGRALRLLIGNIGRARPGEVSKSILGQPGRYTMCIAENEAASPWEPLHVTLGLAADESAVTALGATGTMNVLTPRSDVSAMLTVLGDSLAYLGNPNVVMGKGTVAVLMTPGHARAMAGSGLSKADVAAEIWARSWIPIGRFPASAHPDPPYEFIVRDGRVYPVAGPEQVYVIVAGGPEPTHATVVPSHPSCRPVTERIPGARPGHPGPGRPR
ncbi:MAG: UGSC family (seleno)protein, partial [Streptosporangiaceae bacterium]